MDTGPQCQGGGMDTHGMSPGDGTRTRGVIGGWGVARSCSAPARRRAGAAVPAEPLSQRGHVRAAGPAPAPFAYGRAPAAAALRRPPHS